MLFLIRAFTKSPKFVLKWAGLLSGSSNGPTKVISSADLPLGYGVLCNRNPLLSHLLGQFGCVLDPENQLSIGAPRHLIQVATSLEADDGKGSDSILSPISTHNPASTCYFPFTHPQASTSNYSNSPNVTMTMQAEAIIFPASNIFSTTVLTGQRREHMLTLLYLATYFLRYPSLVQGRECLPELGRADIFELEQHQRRIRLGSKSRRKSGSAISYSSSGSGSVGPSSYSSCGVQDSGHLIGAYSHTHVYGYPLSYLPTAAQSTGIPGATAVACGGPSNNSSGSGLHPHDSGISSQEDITAALYSISAGSSPTHPGGGGMAVCLQNRLTQDQCRLAEAAAHFMVSREVAAAAAAAAVPTNPELSNCPTTGLSSAFGLPGLSPMAIGLQLQAPSTHKVLFMQSKATSNTQYTEIPLLIESVISYQFAFF
ncbi:unnamed protein product [Protopolystoma xenopodis]|uniref:Uncharacterized protein n=1 Tax=Protopolystoma xenopodis TaxID=117903 RepID=A0A3S4ZVA0_9PLAT|nr:unnamed protein product [Protopolystoma xenopodis]